MSETGSPSIGGPGVEARGKVERREEWRWKGGRGGGSVFS